jgi:pSer/pThr/pTyr-binding forkhead associated (FHA) protein
MPEKPALTVQLVHINGPFKGAIQEYSEAVIPIGRHPASLLCFPADMTIISRKHAEIVREGNRFKLIDSSSNGSFVNGKKVRETYLKSGDVLTFAENGPSISFLLQKTSAQKRSPEAPVPEEVPAENADRKEADLEQPAAKNQKKYAQEARAGEPAPEPVKAPLLIQYGPTLRSFTQLPVTIGRSKQCDVVMEQESIFEQHATIFLFQEEYWIRDLTGKECLQINGRPITLQSRLQAQDSVALSPDGPFFVFLGGGRFAEAE